MLNIQRNIPLAPLTTFYIGGPAKYFVEVCTRDELKEALKYAESQSIRYFILGGGSNVLINDNGFDGLVIKINLRNIIQRDNQVEVESGAALSQVLSFYAEHDLSGMEWAAGIPGTFGGAVRGNVGAYGRSMEDVVERVNIIKIPNPKSSAQGGPASGGQFPIKSQIQISNKTEIATLSNKECGFSYRGSVFKKRGEFIIISAILKLGKGNKEDIQKKMREILAQRNSKQPKVFGCAGCFFVNPVIRNKELVEEFEQEHGVKSKEGRIPAGWLIEKVGLKGKKIGEAVISEEHGNYIINTGKATAEDVIILSSLAKQQVRDKLGVQLMEEVQYVGFD